MYLTGWLGVSGGAMEYLSKLGKQAESVAGSFWGHSKSPLRHSGFVLSSSLQCLVSLVSFV